MLERAFLERVIISDNILIIVIDCGVTPPLQLLSIFNTPKHS